MSDESLIFEPGFYTKVRLDDEGRIVDATDLEEDDLPKHKHKIEDIREGLTNEILEVISKLFINSGSTAVKFTYDPKIKKVFADVNIDEDTIIKNEYGQLESTATGEGSSSGGITQEDLAKVDKKLENVKEDLMQEVMKTLAHILVSNPDSAVKFIWDDKLKIYTADVRIDDTSIIKNEYGELQSNGGGGGGSAECGNHTHTTDQISDFEKAVINIFNNFSKTLEFDLSKYIDGSTIKINDEGQLVAVRTALERHTHSLKEIVDYVAPDPAALQPMKDLGDDVDYSKGVINFEKLNIGFSILALSEYLNNVTNKKIENLSKRIDEINLSNDSSTGACTLSVDENSISNILFDKESNFYREVYYSKSLNLIFDYVPILTGNIILLKNGKEVEKADVESFTLAGSKVGSFTVDRVYKKKSFYAKVLRIDVSNYCNSEGSCTFQLKFESGSSEDYSNKIIVFFTPIKEMEYTWEDISKIHTVGATDFYDVGSPRRYKVSIKDFDKLRFVNNSGKFVDGVFTGVEAESFNLKLNNLFNESQLEIKFPLEEEDSNSELYGWRKDILFADIINDTIYPKGECDCSFEIPNSQNYNSLKISGIDLSLCQLRKDKLTANGNKIVSNRTDCGRIPLDTENYGIISFLNNYDSGKENMVLHIKSKDPVDLKNLKIEKMEV